MSDECTCDQCEACERRRIDELDAAVAAHYATLAGSRAMSIMSAVHHAMGTLPLSEQPRSVQMGALLWEQFSGGIHPTQRWTRANVGHDNLLLGGRPAWLNPELPPDAFGFDGYAQPRGTA